MINSRHVLSEVAAACVELQSPFSASSATKVHNFYFSDTKKGSNKDDTPLWPLTLYSLGMFEVNKKVPNIAVVSFSVHSIENPHPFKIHTCKNNEKEVLHRTLEILHLLNVSPLSSQASCRESPLIPSLLSKSEVCLALVQSQPGFH